MADRYLVTCDCGSQVAVAVHQAGTEATCSCGKPIAVPPLRKLRELPREQAAPAATRGGWTPRHAVAMGGIALAIGLFCWGGYIWATEPAMPKFNELNQEQYAQQVAGMLQSGTPLQFWQHWVITGPVLREQGFQEFDSPQRQAVQQHVEQMQFTRNVVLGAGIIVALLTVVAWLAWPRKKAPLG